jgi:hypothetical protein
MLLSLIAGPTCQETDAGFWSVFSDETAGLLNSVSVTDGVAQVDFTADLVKVVCGGACTSARSGALVESSRPTSSSSTESTQSTSPSMETAFWGPQESGCEIVNR